MLGRTHGQPGLPITFGFKAALWAAEVRRHLDRLDEAEPRLAVGQLAGAVGTLSAWGPAGPELQRRLMARLGLGVPEASWLVARDRIAEFAGLLALITGTLAKLGNEVYNLQRPELGELSETPTEGVVGSITMPQKRNPERSEHLWTLARIVRAGAGLALEGLVGEHERDGAAWKTEWAVVPQASAAAATAMALGRELVEGLRVDEARMRANLDAQRGYVLAEPAMLALAERIGKHRAHELVHRAALAGQEAGVTLEEALAADAEIAAALPRDELAALLAPERALGRGETVDAVIARTGAMSGHARPRGRGSSRRPTRLPAPRLATPRRLDPPGGLATAGLRLVTARAVATAGYLGAEARVRRGPAPELVAAGYELELADAPLLHRGLGLADLAHVLGLAERGVIPAADARALLGGPARVARRRRPRSTTPATAISPTRGSVSSSGGSGPRRAGSTPAARGAKRGGSRSGSHCAGDCSTCARPRCASRPP